MSEVILSDYFYGDESEQFIYFRIPRLLITSPRFKHLSTDAKLLYGMLLDRMSLPLKMANPISSCYTLAIWKNPNSIQFRWTRTVRTTGN